jgi:hypothetical protein
MSLDVPDPDTWLVSHPGYPYLSLYLIMTLAAVWDLEIYGKETAAVLIETWKLPKGEKVAVLIGTWKKITSRKKP